MIPDKKVTFNTQMAVYIRHGRHMQDKPASPLLLLLVQDGTLWLPVGPEVLRDLIETFSHPTTLRTAPRPRVDNGPLWSLKSRSGPWSGEGRSLPSAAWFSGSWKYLRSTWGETLFNKTNFMEYFILLFFIEGDILFHQVWVISRCRYF